MVILVRASQIIMQNVACASGLFEHLHSQTLATSKQPVLMKAAVSVCLSVWMKAWPPRSVESTESTFLPAGGIPHTVSMKSNKSQHSTADYNTACCQQSKAWYSIRKRLLCNLFHNEAVRFFRPWWITHMKTHGAFHCRTPVNRVTLV